MNFFLELFQYQFFINALLASIFTSISCGIIGTYIVTKRMVFISGGITHASFGGIGISYYLGLPPLAGAGIFAVISASLIEYFSGNLKVREDSAIAILWSLGMAVGIIFIFLTPGYAPNLMSYLFGSVLTVLDSDIYSMLALSLVNILFFKLFYKNILFISFDEEFVKSQGIKTKFYKYILIILVALTIVMSVRIAGVILVLALLSIPQSIANLFTHKYHKVIFYSIITGLIGTFGGLFVSYYYNLPSGAIMVFTLVIIYLVGKAIKALSNQTFTNLLN